MNNTISEKRYFEEVDIIKGIAILLVIMGHSVRDAYGLPPIVKTLTTSYNMAIFFIVAGFLFSFKDSWTVFLKKKALRLLVPYFAFGLLTIAKRYFFSNYTVGGTINIGESFRNLLFGGYYWFLYALFIFMVVCKAIHNKRVLLIIAVTSFFSPLFIHTDSFIGSRLLHYPFFFILGICLRTHYSAIRHVVVENHKLLGALALSIFCFVMTIMGSDVADRLVKELVGCVFFWIMSIILVELSKHNSYLSGLRHFGKYSLQYYLNHYMLGTIIHSIVLRAHISQWYINYSLVVVMFVFFSWLMLQVEKRFKFTRFISGL